MLFYSTNKNTPKVNFESALLQGLAPDGGLYFPESIPKFNAQEIQNLVGKSLPEVGVTVLQKWLGEEIPLQDLAEIVQKALNFPIPLKQVGPYQVLEVFHGPTQAFKDVAARTLAQLMNYFLHKQGRKALIVVATSGDTGGAVAQGFADLEHIQVVVLYPKDKVSQLQEEQLTRVPNNVISVAVEGVFDDCQKYVKLAFQDPELEHLPLTSANSISIGRLLPQMIYYVYAQSKLQKNNLQFVVPSGNFGNLTAGLFAKSMGLPFGKFIAATNQNDAAVNYYQNGIYEPNVTRQTLSTAMDVGNPSNFVRILELFNHDHQAFQNAIEAIKVSDEETVQTIKSVYEKYHYLLDPHTAVAWKAAEKSTDSTSQKVIISTASPLKFAQEIEDSTGIKVNNSELINQLKDQPQQKHSIPNSYESIKKLLLTF